MIWTDRTVVSNQSDSYYNRHCFYFVLFRVSSCFGWVFHTAFPLDTNNDWGVGFRSTHRDAVTMWSFRPYCMTYGHGRIRGHYGWSLRSSTHVFRWSCPPWSHYHPLCCARWWVPMHGGSATFSQKVNNASQCRYYPFNHDYHFCPFSGSFFACRRSGCCSVARFNSHMYRYSDSGAFVFYRHFLSSGIFRS